MGLWESGDSRDVSYAVEGQTILNLEVYVYGGLQRLALQWPRLYAPGYTTPAAKSCGSCYPQEAWKLSICLRSVCQFSKMRQS